MMQTTPAPTLTTNRECERLTSIGVSSGLLPLAPTLDAKTPGPERDPTARSSIRIQLKVASIEELLASGIVAEFETEMRIRHPGLAYNRVSLGDCYAADGQFVVAYTKTEVCGCGAFRPLGVQTVTIEYLFVRHAHQRRGIGRSILQMLVHEARRRGYVRAVLETAQYQPETIALVQSSGYSKIEPLRPNADTPGCVCFGKSFSSYR